MNKFLNDLKSLGPKDCFGTKILKIDQVILEKFTFEYKTLMYIHTSQQLQYSHTISIKLFEGSLVQRNLIDRVYTHRG